jgi:hypothetical protein
MKLKYAAECLSPLNLNALDTKVIPLSFEKNTQTGVVDLTYCSRKLFGKREIKIFKKCTHFGIADHKGEDKILEITAESCEASFSLHCSFKLSFDHEAMLDSVNNKVFKTVQNESRWEVQGSIATVYPLSELLCREQKSKDDITSKMRKNPSLTYYSVCKNDFYKHAESDSFCSLSSLSDVENGNFESEFEAIATALDSESEFF